LTKGATPSAWSAARPYVVLSIAAAVLTIGLKLGAYLVTGSVGLFSDAAESVVNLVAAVAALWALIYAARPPDEEHAFGHNKAEYFSSGLESALIIIAATWIGVTAWGRLMDPQPLENVGLGLSIALVAGALNGGVALVILRAGRRLRSITLRAVAHPPAHGCLDLFRRGARRCFGATHRMAGARPPDRARRRREHRVDGRLAAG
jgi:cation diffusion facilitator family transporter